MPNPQATVQQVPGGKLQNPGGMMERTASRWRRKAHAEDLGRYALREAGKRSHVADALSRSISTISHEVKDRCHPTLYAAFELMLDLARHPNTGTRSFLDAVELTVTLAEIESQPTGAFIARGLYLLDAEDETCAQEDIAARLSQDAHAESLLRHGAMVNELAAYLKDAKRRRIDLHAEWRAQKCPRAAGEPHRGRSRKEQREGNTMTVPMCAGHIKDGETVVAMAGKDPDGMLTDVVAALHLWRRAKGFEERDRAWVEVVASLFAWREAS